ncbi:MAG TPA: DUF2069 domain-containing protein [Usitatibacter sp.]|nr:DUF2069 domain-containing protein [Usitatibacter sp.]
MNARAARLAAGILLVALIFLGLAWELFLAPLRPGGSWLVLKVLPLLAPLFGILHGRRYTYQWSTLLIWLYAAEGATRVYTDRGMSSVLAGIELALALAYFAAAVAYVRSTRGG